MDSKFVTQALEISQKSPPAPLVSFVGVTTDSRQVRPGHLFVAIEGEKFDGHDFIEQALTRGATGILCRKGKTPMVPAPSAQFFEVEDTLAAIRTLAQAWRGRFKIPVLCVTGSVGKTTTKEFLAAILTGKYTAILKTQGSQNGYLGIAITLLELNPTHQIAVIEVGIDEIGAMEKHMDLLRPTGGLLTAIGPEHLEKLVDVPTAAHEEALSLHALKKSQGIVAINLDDPWIAPLALEFKGSSHSLTYSLSRNPAQCMGSYDGSTIEISCELSKPFTLHVPLPGKHNALNLLGAATLALKAGLSPEEIQTGIKNFKEAQGRSQLHQFPGNLKIICDYYNANPDSMAAGIELLSDLARDTSGRKWACLADMLELGKNEAQFHLDLVPELIANQVDMVLLYGQRMKLLLPELAHRGFKGVVKSFNHHHEMAAFLISGLRSNDVVLIKGSRSMKMEEVWKELEPHAKLHHANS
jgi:UDP-N-acetylmuramoyl-tripeptide--D-alanyl-D-alanine ligase